MTIAMRVWRGWVVAPALACSMLAVGCGDDDDGESGPDAGDAGMVVSDAGLDGSVTIDGGMDGSVGDAGWRSDAGPISEKIVKADIAAAGHDRFYGVAYDAAGNIYAVGQTLPGKETTSDSSFVVAKYLASGALDTTFGQAGYAVKNVSPGAQSYEAARGVVVQADGKIVLAGEAEHEVFEAGVDAGLAVRDTDIVLVRFNANGTVDESFGTAGVVRHDLGTGVEIPASPLQDGGVQAASWAGADSTYSLSLTTDGKLVIHGASRTAETDLLPDGGARTDTDYTLVRLTADGALDTSFATTGVLRTDVGKTGAGARVATVLADGSIVAAGYTSSTVLGRQSQNPVIYKVKPDGTRDATFATGDATATPVGLWHDFARADQKNAEAYGAAPQGSKFVTVGYGPSPNNGSATTDWVFFRFNGDGSQDKSFGEGGQTFIDASGFGDNGRTLAVLPDNRVIAGGVGRKSNMPTGTGFTQGPQDGMIAVLGPDGQPDESFAPGGYKLLDLGGNTDQFLSMSVAPSKKQVAVVGQAGSAEGDDDGALLILTLP